MQHKAWARKFGITASVVSALVSIALGQEPPAGRATRGPARNQGNSLQKKARPDAADPLAKVSGAGVKPAPGTFHFDFKMRSFDGTPLASSYYPSKQASSAPVIMLVHETGRSRKDFEEPVLELKGQGLGEHLQGLGYAVLSMDLRWQGQNPRRALSADERPKLVEDLQAAYFFLVDRHNRGDLNLAKLGVIALGDGANLVVAWASRPGAAATVESRGIDLSTLVLISPRPQGFGYVFEHALAPLTSRVPLFLLAGERDVAAKDTLEIVGPMVQRARLNKIQLFPSSLSGYKLLRLEPKVTTVIFHFLETTLKNRPVEWEPEYNLTPISFGDIQLIQNAKMTARKDQAKDLEQAKPAGIDPVQPKADSAKKAKNSPRVLDNIGPMPPKGEKAD